MITVGTPHLGTSEWYRGAFSQYSSLAEFESDVPEWAAIRWVIPQYDSLYEMHEGLVEDPVGISYLFSNTLAADPAPGVFYYCIYSYRHKTDRDITIVRRKDFDTSDWYEAKKGGKYSTSLGGDGYITAESASAFGTPYAVSGNKNTKHSVLLNNVDVQAHILSILRASP